jgi:hypothetical protein
VNVERFVKLMTGHFDNKEQFTEMKEEGKIFPYAQHVNTVCNDKIKNLKSLHQHISGKGWCLGRGQCEPIYPGYGIQAVGEIFRHLSGGIRKYGSPWKENIWI